MTNPDTETPRALLERLLTKAMNYYGMDSALNTPDYILGAQLALHIAKDVEDALAAAPNPLEDAELVERVAKAICCPDGKCQVAVSAEREGPESKYLTKVPCHALGMTGQARAAIAAIGEMK